MKTLVITTQRRQDTDTLRHIVPLGTVMGLRVSRVEILDDVTRTPQFDSWLRDEVYSRVVGPLSETPGGEWIDPSRVQALTFEGLNVAVHFHDGGKSIHEAGTTAGVNRLINVIAYIVNEWRDTGDTDDCTDPELISIRAAVRQARRSAERYRDACAILAKTPPDVLPWEGGEDCEKDPSMEPKPVEG